MKTAVKILFLSTALFYGALSTVQILQLIAHLHPGLSSKGFGFAYQVPNNADFLGAIILLNAFQLLVSVFIGVVGLQLIRGRLWHVKSASILALFAFPIGTISGICGLFFLGSQKNIENKH